MHDDTLGGQLPLLSSQVFFAQSCWPRAEKLRWVSSLVRPRDRLFFSCLEPLPQKVYIIYVLRNSGTLSGNSVSASRHANHPALRR